MLYLPCFDFQAAMGAKKSPCAFRRKDSGEQVKARDVRETLKVSPDPASAGMIKHLRTKHYARAPAVFGG